MRYFIVLLLSLFAIQAHSKMCAQLIADANQQRQVAMGGSFPYSYQFSRVQKVGDKVYCFAVDSNTAVSHGIPDNLGECDDSASKCVASKNNTTITVNSTQFSSVCYQGCIYNEAPKSGCVAVDFDSGVGKDGKYPDGSRPGQQACGFNQTADPCDGKNGEFSTPKKPEWKPEDKTPKPSDPKPQPKPKDNTDPKDTDHCKSGTYDASDPYFVKCPNLDKNGKAKDANTAKDSKTDGSTTGSTDGKGNTTGTGTANGDSSLGTASGANGNGKQTGSTSKDAPSALDSNSAGIPDAKGDGKDKKGASDPQSSDGKYPDDLKMPERGLNLGSAFNTSLLSSSKSCPADTSVTLSLFNTTLTFSYAHICQGLSWIGSLVMICAYLYASKIVLDA